MLLLRLAIACSAPETAPDPEPPEPAALCGDGVVGGGEQCDDGNGFGGDGCLPDCSDEPAPRESEPNDTWEDANPWSEPVSGGLPAGDIDCFSVEVPSCLPLSASLTGDCPADAVLTLHDPIGIAIATGSVGPAGCPAIDPVESPGARFAAEGPHAVCVSSLTGADIPTYTLDIALGTGAEAFPISAADDPDGDGLPDRCDPDRDGDGALDEDDNCPDIGNGPLTPPLAPSAAGFLRDWLVLAPIVGTVSPYACLPSLDELTGGDAALAPSLGDPEADLVWQAHLGTSDVFDFLPDFGFVEAPREVYAHTYVFSAAERATTLAVGADDGVRAWLEGAVVLDIETCQGTNIDQFQVPVTLLAGWNRLTVKVRDQGGGWGLAVRFLDAGVPVTDLELSISPDGSWAPDQSDADGDGLGDLCDPTPTG